MLQGLRVVEVVLQLRGYNEQPQQHNSAGSSLGVPVCVRR